MYTISKGAKISAMIPHLEMNDWSDATVHDCLALLDNGATYGASCINCTDWAVPGTFFAHDAGTLKCGSVLGALEAKGSHLYVLRRVGAQGEETVVRRLLYVPDLPVAMLFAEPDEHRLGYSLVWPYSRPRALESPTGEVIKLHMSASGLGWLHVEPVPDGAERAALLSKHRLPSEHCQEDDKQGPTSSTARQFIDWDSDSEYVAAVEDPRRSPWWVCVPRCTRSLWAIK